MTGPERGSHVLVTKAADQASPLSSTRCATPSRSMPSRSLPRNKHKTHLSTVATTRAAFCNHQSHHQSYFFSTARAAFCHHQSHHQSGRVCVSGRSEPWWWLWGKTARRAAYRGANSTVNMGVPEV